LAPWGWAAESGFNYAEALQKSLYFYEAQQSGALSPNNWPAAALEAETKLVPRFAVYDGGKFIAGEEPGTAP
jgi:hypothetical protein